MSVVATIESFAARSGVFDFMNTAWAWPLAESLHFIGLSLLLGSVGILDLRLLGYPKGLAITELHRITRWGIVGFALNVITGFAFFVSAPDQYLYNPAVQLKALCLLIAFLNVVAFYAFVWPHLQNKTDPRFREDDGCQSIPIAAKLCAAISLSAWIGVIVFGRLITFYRPPEHWCFWCAG